MNILKFLLIAVLSICFIGSVNAQTYKRKKSKSKTVTAAIKYQCPMKCEGDKAYTKADKCPVCGMALSKVQKEIASYQCPTECEGNTTYAKEGKCPVCNMNLTKVDTKKTTTTHDGHIHN